MESSSSKTAVKLAPPLAPCRTDEQVIQLLLGTLQPEKCTTPCTHCGTNAPYSCQAAAAKRLAASTVKRDPDDVRKADVKPIDVPSVSRDAGQMDARQKSVVYQNGATSHSSPLNKRVYDQGGPQDDPEDIRHQTKYRTSMYRGAASFSPLPSGVMKKMVPTAKGKKSQEDVKKPTLFRFWRIMYAKPSGRKNKIWEDDGTLAIEGKQFVLRSSTGKELGRSSGATPEEIEELHEGKVMLVGSKEVQLLDGISDEDYENKAYLD
ncbi:hypothetical protein BV898_09619 [Hypsibius exemplaris]|uniref:DUF2439 domain-containing protein n=1 Tax=Hypsibius exemplaris TaxID=2072580 RepID=A0A1W0WM73_HYPEX|nr:hypothetical protein BV898_09619 [Hypsibius exemplaris]